MSLIENIRAELYDEDTILPELQKLILADKVIQLSKAINIAEREMDIVVDRMYLFRTAPYNVSQEMFNVIFQDMEIDQDYIQYFMKKFPFKRVVPYIVGLGIPIGDVIEAYFRRESFDQEYWLEDCDHSSEECEDCIPCLERTESYKFLKWIIDKYNPRDLGTIVNDFEALIIRHIHPQIEV